jgi:predicted DNA repair protein MutK
VTSDPDASIWMRAIVLAVVAVLITVLVYGVVALLVKMDDVGLHLAQKPSAAAQRVGQGLVKAMPKVLTAIGVIGTAAMLWVGGHILLVSLYEIGGEGGLLEGTALGDVLHAPYDLIHHWEEDVHHALGSFGAIGGWAVNTLLSAIVGLVVGGIVVAALGLFGVGKHEESHDGEHGADHAREQAAGTVGEHGEHDPGEAPEDSSNR